MVLITHKWFFVDFWQAVEDKPMISLGEIFGKPKDKQKATEVKGIVYKFECPDCSFKYVGESK